MGKYIVKFTDSAQNKDYYLFWSTIVDAPTSYGCGLQEFTDWYKELFGSEGMREFEQRMERVREKGTSSMMDSNVKSLIAHNRAGKGETTLTYEQIVHEYCILPNQDPPIYLHGVVE